MSCIHLHAPQGTQEWFEARCGSITASMFSECRKRLKSGPNKGDYNSAAKDYAFKLAVERVSGQILDEPQFDPWQARRGRELEPEARLAYESRHEAFTEQTGLALTEDKLFGASVDGLIDDDGIQEIKCFLAPAKIKGILLDRDLTDYLDQIQGGLWITGRQWCHFTLYCPALKNIGADLTVIEVQRDDDHITEMEIQLLEFNECVEEYHRQLRGMSDMGAIQRAAA